MPEGRREHPAWSDTTLLEAISSVWPKASSARVIARGQPLGRRRERDRLRLQADGRTWIVEIATNSDAAFYLRRSVEWARRFAESCPGGGVITPSHVGECPGCVVSITQERHIQSLHHDEPPEWVLRLGTPHHRLPMTDAVRERIVSGLLEAWPEHLHRHVRRMSAFDAWLQAMRDLEHVDLGVEHGDLAPNNILVSEDGPLLIDFEFAKRDQLAGFDLYANRRIRGKKYPDLEPNLLEAMHRKWDLCQAINADWDEGCIGALVRQRGSDRLEFVVEAQNGTMMCVHAKLDNRGLAHVDHEGAATLSRLEQPCAEALANRWRLDRCRIVADGVAADAPICGALRANTFFAALHASRRPLRTLRRLLFNRRCFAWMNPSRGDLAVASIGHGTLIDLLRRPSTR